MFIKGWHSEMLHKILKSGFRVPGKKEPGIEPGTQHRPSTQHCINECIIIIITIFLSRFLCCSYNLGSGPISVLTNRTWNDGDWHTVTIQRTGPSGTLVVDEGKRHMVTTPGPMKSLDINNGVFLGK